MGFMSPQEEGEEEDLLFSWLSPRLSGRTCSVLLHQSLFMSLAAESGPGCDSPHQCALCPEAAQKYMTNLQETKSYQVQFNA